MPLSLDGIGKGHMDEAVCVCVGGGLREWYLCPWDQTLLVSWSETKPEDRNNFWF